MCADCVEQKNLRREAERWFATLHRGKVVTDEIHDYQRGCRRRGRFGAPLRRWAIQNLGIAISSWSAQKRQASLGYIAGSKWGDGDEASHVREEDRLVILVLVVILLLTAASFSVAFFLY